MRKPLTLLVTALLAACEPTAASSPDAQVHDAASAADAAADATARVPSCAASRDDALPWARCTWGPWQEFAAAVAYDPTTGDLLVGGDTLRDTVVDGVTHQPSGEQDGFLARWSPSGKLLNWKTFGGPFVQSNADHVQRVRVADDGAIFVAGTYGGDMDLGGCTLPGDQIVQHQDRRELFVARLASDFSCVWAKRGVSIDFDEVDDLALLPANAGVVVSGYVGVGNLGLADGRQAFISAFDRDGKVKWGHAGNEVTVIQAAGSLAVAADGRVAWVASGLQAGTFLGFPIEHKPFVAVFAPDGKIQWLRSMDGAVSTVAFRPGGGLTVVGAGYLAQLGVDGTTESTQPLDLPGLWPMGERTGSSAAVRVLDDGGLVAAVRSTGAGQVGGVAVPAGDATLLVRRDGSGQITAVQGPWPRVQVRELALGAGGVVALAGAYKGDTSAAGIPLEATTPDAAWTDALILQTKLP